MSSDLLTTSFDGHGPPAVSSQRLRPFILTRVGFLFNRPTYKKRFQKTNTKKHMRTHDVQNLFTNFHLKINEKRVVRGGSDEEDKNKFEL